jgi:hypothetical protein
LHNFAPEYARLYAAAAQLDEAIKSTI